MKCHVVRRIQTPRGELHLQMFPDLPIVPGPGWAVRDANGRTLSVETTTLVFREDGSAEILCALELRDAVDLLLEEQGGWSPFP